MPIAVLCGNCNAKLNAPDAAAGKKVKCPKCATILQIPAPESEPDFEVVDDEPAPPPKAKSKPKPVVLEDDEDAPRPPAKKKPVVLAEDDEEDEPKPKKKKGKAKPAAKSNSLPLLIGGGVLGLALVGFLLYWFVIRTPEVAKAPDTNTPQQPEQKPPTPKPPAPKEEWQEVTGEGFAVQIPKFMVPFELERAPEKQVLGGREWSTPGRFSGGYSVTRVSLVPKSNRTDAEIEELAKRTFRLLRNDPPVIQSAKLVPVTGGQGVELTVEGGREDKYTYLAHVIIRPDACYVLRASPGAVYTLNGVTSYDNEPAVRFFESFRFADGPKQPTPGGTGTNPGGARKWVPTDLTAQGFPVVIDLPANVKIRVHDDPKQPFVYINPTITSTIAVQQAGGGTADADVWKKRDMDQFQKLKMIEEKPGRYFGECPDEDLGKGMKTFVMCVEVESGGKKYLVHANLAARSRQDPDFFWATLTAAKGK